MATLRLNAAALNRFLNGPVQNHLLKKAQEIADEARSNAPVGATGDLRNSIVVERTSGGGATVKVTAAHAGFVHQGTGAGHIPNPRPNYFPRVRKSGLVIWADAKNANPYKVAHGIAAQGTPSNPFLERAIEKVLGSSKFRWVKRDLET